MGEAVPLNIALQSTNALTTAVAPPTTTIATMILSTPDTLPVTTRPISLTGTIFDLMENGTFSMKTSFGTIRLVLVDAQLDLKKTLESLLNTETGISTKVELIIQPGAHPKEATLIVSSAEKMERPTQSEVVSAKTASRLTPSMTQPQGKGSDEVQLKITVLPDKIKISGMVEEKACEPNLRQQTAAENKGEQVPKFIARIMGAPAKEDAPSLLKPDQVSRTAPKTPTTPGTSTLDPGKTYQLKVTQMLPPTAEWPSETLSPHMIQATVIGKSLTGQLIMQSEEQTVISHVKSDLPLGTKLIAQVQPVSEDPLTLLPLDKGKDFLPLRNIVELLQTISPKGAEAFLQMRVPNPVHHFAGTTLFLLSALHGGKVDEWLGPAALHVLEKENKQNLKEKLVGSIKDSLDSIQQDRTIGEWKAYPIPLHFEGAFELLNLYVHKDGHRQHNDTPSGATTIKTRFVITMNMSKLGSIQLDGLSQKRQLDLVIRSEYPLPEALATSIRETAIASLEAVGLIGSLNVQSGRQNWISFEDVRAKPASVVT
ncbi:MAG: hypothetical protein PHD48_10455 [Alphaproteobacteria bacterium]|nr:hypothetical protein [Alphaproteobacteria bacterium]